MISRTTTKIAALLAILSIAGFFIYKGVAGPMKINMPETNPVRLTSGLVGYWTFDGQDTNWGTNTTNDRSGNGYNGTMTNMSTSTSPVPGVVGQALNFDGSDDFVSINDNDNLDLNGTNFTISAWAKAINETSNGIIISKGTNLWDNQFSYQLSFNMNSGNNRIDFGIDDNVASGWDRVSTSNGFVQNNTWYHIIGVKSGTDIILYVNGNYINTTAITKTMVATTESVFIGGVPGSSLLVINGAIDEVRVYNRAISASEITELYNQGQTKINASQANKLTSGLVGYYTMDGNDINWGTNLITNRGSLGGTGTLTNMSTTTSPVPGVNGQALNFDGSTSYVDTGQDTAFDLTSDLTISAWINKQSGGGSPNSIVSKFDAGTFIGPWVFRTGQSNGLLEYSAGSAAYGDEYNVTGQSTFSFGQWHHVVVVRNNTTARVTFYIDSVQDSGGWQLYNTASVESNNITAKIGRKANLGGGAHAFNGKIDEVRVYNRAISASEITELYQQGQTKINASQANKLTSGLVGHWTFDGQDTNWGTNTTNDRSGNSYNGTMVSMSTSTSPAPGVAGQALNFDGSDDYITIPYSSSFSLTGSFTISGWFKKTNTTTQVFMAKSAGLQGRNFTYWAGSTVSFDKGGAAIITGSTTIQAGQWYHTVLTYNGSQLSLYLNGQSDATPVSTSALTNSSYDLQIGVRWRGDEASLVNYFNGSVDEVRIYNDRALNASEVQELYNQGR